MSDWLKFKLNDEVARAARVDMRDLGVAIVRFDPDGTQTLIDPLDVRLSSPLPDAPAQGTEARQGGDAQCARCGGWGVMDIATGRVVQCPSCGSAAPSSDDGPVPEGNAP